MNGFQEYFNPWSKPEIGVIFFNDGCIRHLCLCSEALAVKTSDSKGYRMIIAFIIILAILFIMVVIVRNKRAKLPQHLRGGRVHKYTDLMTNRLVSKLRWLLLFLLVPFFFSFAAVFDGHSQENVIDSERSHGENIFLTIECHSGTPLVLEFVLTDKEQIVECVYFDFDDDGIVDLGVDVPEEKEGEEASAKVIFRGAPYWQRGVYTPSLFLKTRYGTFLRKYTVACTDFIWGRDNYNFANDGKFENAIDFVSKTLIEWAEERFGSLTQEQQVILLHIMYSIYKGSIGRCYGFSGGEVFYFEHPEDLPYPYRNTYSMSEWDSEIIKEMDWVQNDIVFSNFILCGVDFSKKQDAAMLLSEIDKIKRSIDSGRLIILGYISPKMHHSMVVYGYFVNHYRESTTLVVANNWERTQEHNTFSEDAENIVITTKDGEVKVSWYDLTKKEYRHPEMLFAIERKYQYLLRAEDFFALIDATEKNLIADGRIILMIEETEVAYIIDEEGKRRGYKKPRYFNETDGISFKKIDYNYIFELPKGREYKLILYKARYNKEFETYKDVNLYGIIPAESDVLSFVYSKIQVDDKSETVFFVNDEGVLPER